LQGRVAGVSVYHDGSPGTATEVRIRGAAAIDAGAAPLYVLDGMPVNSSDVANLNTSDIESITVLKDNAAASIYGYRAAHGAIIITSRRITPQKPEGVPRYDELEDIDYIQELSAIGAERKYAAYLELRTGERANDAAFYFDVAEHFFQSGLKEEALTVLSNLAEINKEDHQLLRAMGYMLETWKDYEEAIDVFRKILKLKEEEPQSYRDLALALARAGQYQQASEILLEVLKKDWQWYEQRYNGLRGIMLNELNGIIALHADDMNMTAFPSEIIRPLPADLRIVIDWNKDETDIDLHVVEPDGEECFYQHTLTKNRGRISHDFTNGYGPEEYEVRNALKGKYRIRVNYYGDRYQKTSVPSYIRLTIYRNFGRPDQQMEMKTFIMDGQSGMLEIATEKI
jgi:TonB-dependent SusC/RagA subfamily outer membrane receptor